MADDLIPGVAAPYLKLVAGFAGAVVSLAFLKDQGRWQMLINAGGGCAASVFLSPQIIDWIGVKSDGGTYAAIFLTGLLSMSFLAGLMVIAKAWRENPSDAAGAIADIIGKLRGSK
jgi:predicted permease